MKKFRFKSWFRYKLKRLLVRLRTNSSSFIQRIEAKKSVKLNEIQKPLYDICLKLIADPNSELRSNSVDYTFHIENELFLIIIRSNTISNENYSISLMDSTGKSRIPFVDIPFPTDHVKTIVDKFDKEVHKRMKSRQLLKTTKVANHLRMILKNIEEKQLVE